jgi:uncharacterized iron-regulated protein
MLWSWAIGLGLVITGGSYPPLVMAETNIKADLTQQQIIERILPVRVVYLGEIHDSEADRVAKANIIRSLHRQRGRANNSIAIGMEMFQRPFQQTVDLYLAGKISETDFLDRSEYQKRWGFDWKYYVDVVRFAKKNRIPIIALNAPTEVTRKVAKQGIESLTPTDKQYIPPLSEIDRSNIAYRDRLFASYQQHKATAQLNSKTFDRFYTAQLLWDETMAESIANFAIANPNRQIVVIAGQAHIAYGEGIPDRVRRRLINRPNSNSFSQATILLSTDKATADLKPQPTDFIWKILDR